MKVITITMIINTVIALTVFIAGYLIFLNVKDYEKKMKQEEKKTGIKYIAKENTYLDTISTLEHNGHLFTTFTHGYNNCSIIHSPSCPCLKNVNYLLDFLQ